MAKTPVTSLPAPRHAGWKVLARQTAVSRSSSFLGLEPEPDLGRHDDPGLALEILEGLFILDEAQHVPHLSDMLAFVWVFNPGDQGLIDHAGVRVSLATRGARALRPP